MPCSLPPPLPSAPWTVEAAVVARACRPQTAPDFSPEPLCRC